MSETSAFTVFTARALALAAAGAASFALLTVPAHAQDLAFGSEVEFGDTIVGGSLSTEGEVSPSNVDFDVALDFEDTVVDARFDSGAEVGFGNNAG
ncbi:hypothetical protein [Nocardiopsis rhodophaea]|uniref:hypothetical protein n=1 Tax=Nocardiopsis rhodophaea TaxID=280238 RepID=UPI0031DCCFB7